MTRVIEAIAYIWSIKSDRPLAYKCTIITKSNLWHHRVILSMADEHNVHINLCPQNKICVAELSGKLISQNVLTCAAAYCSLAGLKLQHCLCGYLAVGVYHCRAVFICKATVRVTTVHMEEVV